MTVSKWINGKQPLIPALPGSLLPPGMDRTIEQAGQRGRLG